MSDRGKAIVFVICYTIGICGWLAFIGWVLPAWGVR